MAYERDPLSLVPMVFGSMMHALNKFITPENWQTMSAEIFQWSHNRVMTLYERDVPASPPPEHISTEEIKKIYGLGLNKGKFTKEAFKVWMKERGYDGLGKVLKKDFKNLCDEVSDPTVGKRFNAKV